MSGHTPGPWIPAEAEPVQVPWVCWYARVVIGPDQDSRAIATVYGDCHCNNNPENKSIVEANARLIAAAPQLLNLVRRLTDLVFRLHTGEVLHDEEDEPEVEAERLLAEIEKGQGLMGASRRTEDLIDCRWCGWEGPRSALTEWGSCPTCGTKDLDKEKS